MSSSATPHGARPVGTIVGSPYQGKVTHYKIKNAFGTSIFFGDFVKWADDNPNTTIQKDTGTTSLTPIGVFTCTDCCTSSSLYNRKVFTKIILSKSFI